MQKDDLNFWNSSRLKRSALIIFSLLLIFSFAGCGSEEASGAGGKAELALADMDLTGDWVGNFTITSHEMSNLSEEEMEGCEQQFGAAIAEAIVKQFDALVDQPLGFHLNFQKEQDSYHGSGSLTIPAKLLVLTPDATEDKVSELPEFEAVVENNELHFSIKEEDQEDGSLNFTGKALKENVLSGTFSWDEGGRAMIEGTWQVTLQQ